MGLGGLEGGHSSRRPSRAPPESPGPASCLGLGHTAEHRARGLQPLLPAEVSGQEPPAVTAPLLLPSPSNAVTVVILTTTSVTRRRWPLGAETPPAGTPPRVRPPPPHGLSAPPARPAGPIHCGGGAGSAGRGAEMGAPPPPPPARALPQDGAGQAAALAVRGQGGPGGRPGRRLGPGGAARPQPFAAGPRRGLRGQRRGPEVGARAWGPREPPGGALLLPLASRAGTPLGCTCRVACSPGEGGDDWVPHWEPSPRHARSL